VQKVRKECAPMNNGLTQNGWKDFKDILTKANVYQLIEMQRQVADELERRGVEQ
jgi:hypothetical protein